MTMRACILTYSRVLYMLFTRLVFYLRARGQAAAAAVLNTRTQRTHGWYYRAS